MQKTRFECRNNSKLSLLSGVFEQSRFQRKDQQHVFFSNSKFCPSEKMSLEPFVKEFKLNFLEELYFENVDRKMKAFYHIFWRPRISTKTKYAIKPRCYFCRKSFFKKKTKKSKVHFLNYARRSMDLIMKLNRRFQIVLRTCRRFSYTKLSENTSECTKNSDSKII